MIYKTTDSHLKLTKGRWVRHWNYYTTANYYKSLSVGCLWSRLLWHYRSSSVATSRRLSSSVSSAIQFVLRFDLLNRRKCTHFHTRMCFQTSSAFLVRNLSVWETYLSRLISRSSLQFLIPCSIVHFY